MHLNGTGCIYEFTNACITIDIKRAIGIDGLRLCHGVLLSRFFTTHLLRLKEASCKISHKNIGFRSTQLHLVVLLTDHPTVKQCLHSKIPGSPSPSPVAWYSFAVGFSGRMAFELGPCSSAVLCVARLVSEPFHLKLFAFFAR